MFVRAAYAKYYPVPGKGESELNARRAPALWRNQSGLSSTKLSVFRERPPGIEPVGALSYTVMRMSFVHLILRTNTNCMHDNETEGTLWKFKKRKNRIARKANTRSIATTTRFGDLAERSEKGLMRIQHVQQ